MRPVSIFPVGMNDFTKTKVDDDTAVIHSRQDWNLRKYDKLGISQSPVVCVKAQVKGLALYTVIEIGREPLQTPARK